MDKRSPGVAVLALLAAGSAHANFVPERPESELLESAELVVDARIVATRIGVHLPQQRRWTDQDGTLNFSSGVRKPCVRAAVERHIKGRSGSTVIVCSSIIAEAPALPKRGQFVRMYLKRDGTVWSQLIGGHFRLLEG
jgi:hypothetical protein